MRNKKGSHVGMVLSFTLFIVFLIFVYAIVGSPVRTQKQNENLFENIQDEIIAETTSKIYTARAYDDINMGGCIEINNTGNEFSNVDVIVRNSSEEIGAEINGDVAYIEGGKGFMKIYYSDNYFEEETSFSGTGCVRIDIDSVSEEERILEDKILILLDEMKNNYSLVKEKFGIDGTVDFHLEFVYENGTKIRGSEFNEELKREIFAIRFNINYLAENAEEKIGEFIVRTW